MATTIQDATAKMTGEAQRFAFLDSMRFGAAALVVFQHLAEHRGYRGLASVLVVLGPGVAGVALFFFISGYVIPLSVRRGFEPVDFLIRRLCRIYPLFLAAILTLAVAGASGLLPQWQFVIHAPIGDWLANLLLVQEFVGVRPFLGVSWTLAIEFIWYGLFAAALALFGQRAATMLDLLMPLSLLLIAAVSLLIETRLPTGRPTMIYAAVIGYQCYRFVAGDIQRARLVRSIGLFALVAVATNYVAFGVYRHPNVTLAQTLGPWAFSTGLFLTVVLSPKLRAARLLNAGLVPRLGAMSYSTYLLHPVAIALATLYLPSARVPGALALTLLLSIIGYRLVERPGIELGRWLVGTGRLPKLRVRRI